jgi:hypothetical protein
MASLSDEEIERALSRYMNMRSRRDVRLAFLPMGPLVTASTPEELNSETIQALVTKSKGISS